MSTRWERLAGDTSEFALKLAFARDPDDSRGAEPDVSLSWGSFQLWVEGHNLCAHNEGGERSESVHWYLLPLLEWLVSHWNRLLQYLLSLAPGSDRLKTLGARVARLRGLERHRNRRLMWLAGLGTDEHTIRTGWRRVKRYLSECAEGPRRAMLEASESSLVVTGSCQASLMFGSLSPNVRRGDVLELARAIVELYVPHGDQQPIDDAVLLRESGDPSWYQGYELAESVHERIGTTFTNDVFVDIGDVLRQLGVKVVDRELSDEAIRGVALHGAHHRPGILVNSRNSTNAHPFGRRFTLAHELCHLLFDREIGAHLAIASGPWAPRDIERRANAYAAMFLMPNQLVRRAVSALSGSLETKDAVLDVANRLQTSFESTLWHLKNLGYIDDVTRERIENEALQQQPL